MKNLIDLVELEKEIVGMVHTTKTLTGEEKDVLVARILVAKSRMENTLSHKLPRLRKNYIKMLRRVAERAEDGYHKKS